MSKINSINSWEILKEKMSNDNKLVDELEKDGRLSKRKELGLIRSFFI